MPSVLRSELLALALGTDHEIERMGDASVALAHLYAWTLQDLQQRLSEPIAAAGVHGQTIRHRPERGFTLQLNHPALVAELSGIDIIADFPLTRCCRRWRRRTARAGLSCCLLSQRQVQYSSTQYRRYR